MPGPRGVVPYDDSLSGLGSEDLMFPRSFLGVISFWQVGQVAWRMKVRLRRDVTQHDRDGIEAGTRVS